MLTRSEIAAKLNREVRIMHKLVQVSKSRRVAAFSNSQGSENSVQEVQTEPALANKPRGTVLSHPTSPSEMKVSLIDHPKATINRDVVITNMQQELSSVLDRIQSLSERVVKQQDEKQKLLQNMENSMMSLASDQGKTNDRMEVWNPSRIKPMSSIYYFASKAINVHSNNHKFTDDSARQRAYNVLKSMVSSGSGEAKNERQENNAKSDMQEQRLALLDEVAKVSNLQSVEPTHHKATVQVNNSHFYTYEKDEVVAAGGKYKCADCGSTSRALKLDVDEHSVDLYCEPCWMVFYGETFDGRPFSSLP